jgi:hypothetical protein
MTNSGATRNAGRTRLAGSAPSGVTSSLDLLAVRPASLFPFSLPRSAAGRAGGSLG